LSHPVPRIHTCAHTHSHITHTSHTCHTHMHTYRIHITHISHVHITHTHHTHHMHAYLSHAYHTHHTHICMHTHTYTHITHAHTHACTHGQSPPPLMSCLFGRFSSWPPHSGVGEAEALSAVLQGCLPSRWCSPGPGAGWSSPSRKGALAAATRKGPQLHFPLSRPPVRLLLFFTKALPAWSEC
jgi:hypothetical protein